MRIIHSLRTIAAVTLGIALSGPALSQNIVEPASPSAARPDMGAYQHAMKTTKSDYKAASAKCRAMGAGAEQRNCMADAKATRKVDTANAKRLRTSAVTSQSTTGGATAPSK